ncbi:molecular chaperone HscC [Endozoicomonas sp. SM1973]|uniref:Molecular chaperone HscC n=1 Tax=Spartinivicinus marinus TaxID=2994442 RepID=A0A853I341_9GAMM|nr:molecular chaperone HscC [Spartinivicinus marinus]MCX4028005.1 molecular chaperone HscC [Spartinivicinus marinus]NYZ68370.1 molecular chaperone HscC [Spartinivicinus marinus]
MSIIGIDLGTTNSLISVWQNGQAVVIPNVLGDALTPSVVGLDDNGEVLVGKAAKERLYTHPAVTVELFKRYMGSEKEYSLANHTFKPQDLASFVLRALKADAEAYLGCEVTEAVISVPAYFNEQQRRATQLAGQLAGLKVERLISEPTAAALAYGMVSPDVEKHYMIFDLGGGTFDVSVLELFDGVMEVNASAGDNHLGGEDFLDVLLNYFCEKVNANKEELTQAAYTHLRSQVNRAKHQLSTHHQTTIQFKYNDEQALLTVTRDEFEKLCEPLINRLRLPVERALRDAKIKPADVDELILVGGSTRMVLVRSLVAKLFGRLPSCHLNPDQVVAMGAAVQAGLKQKDQALREIVMTDVCPYSLGVEVSSSRVGYYDSGLFSPILERNTVVPASRVERFTTSSDQQAKVNIKIYQGESRRVKDNIKLSNLMIEVPPKPAGEEAVDIRFTYDVNGILEVEVKVVSTGQQATTVIEEYPGLLTPAEIAAKLAALSEIKIHPRDSMENRLLMARGERLYEQALGEQREYIGELLMEFETVLAQQDTKKIRQVNRDLNQLFDEIAAELYLL